MSKKLRLTMKTAMTLQEGIAEFYLNCEARNLRPGTIKHYKDSVVQIYKVVPPETPIHTIDEDTWDTYKITLREKVTLRDTSIYTYGRDFKTILRFFMKEGWLPHMELSLPKADKAPTETYTDEELMMLLKKPNLKKCGFTEYKCWVMVNFLLSTGVRQNSLINIRIHLLVALLLGQGLVCCTLNPEKSKSFPHTCSRTWPPNFKKAAAEFLHSATAPYSVILPA